MAGLERLEERVGSLEVEQARTTEVVSAIKEQLGTHIHHVESRMEKEDQRHEVLLKLVEKVDGLNDLKVQQDKNTKGIATVSAVQKSHGWLIKAIVGVTILAVLGSVVGTIGVSCSGMREARAEDKIEHETKTERHESMGRPSKLMR